MTIDLLGPISHHIAQIAENAFEEGQPDYAIDSLRLVFQSGLYPSRDLFLAILAVIASEPVLGSNSIGKRFNKDAQSKRGNHRFEVRKVDKQTIVSAIELVTDLVQSCPNAIRRYLPPFYREERDNLSRTKALDEELNHEIEWKKEQRNWLRKCEDDDGPSSPEDSRPNSRNRSPVTNNRPIIGLATRFLECNDIFTFLALNPFEKQDIVPDGRSRSHFDRKGLNTRDGDDEEAADARESELRNKYDRPSTWTLLNILCSFWQKDFRLCEKFGKVEGQFKQTPHLVLQVTNRNWRTPITSRGNAGFITVLADALDLIKIGLLPSVGIVSLKKERIERDIKSATVCQFLGLLEMIAADGIIDRQTLIRGVSSVMERADAYALEKMDDANLLISQTTLFARSAMRHLSHWQGDDTTLPWDDEMEERIASMIKNFAWDVQQRDFLRLFQQGSWLLNKDDWSFEEGLEVWRMLKDVPDDEHKTIYDFLSLDSWQLYLNKSYSTRTKKRSSDNANSSEEIEDRMRNFAITSEIRRKTIDQMVKQTQLQKAILKCFQRFFVEQYPDRAGLDFTLIKAADVLADNIKSDYKVIENCLKGMQVTHQNILQDGLSKKESNDFEESRKRRRTADGKVIPAKRSLSFVVEWRQVEKRIKKYLMILEAASFAFKSPAVHRERESVSSDLTDLTEE